MIDEKKFIASKDYYINNIKPDIEIYSQKEFTRIVRYKIKYAIIKNRNILAQQKKFKAHIKKLCNKLDKLEKQFINIS